MTHQQQQRPTTLNFITGNANKLAEVRAILSDVAGLDLQSRDVPGLDEIQGTIEEIARDKCRRAAERVSFSYFWVDEEGGLVRCGAFDGRVEVELCMVMGIG